MIGEAQILGSPERRAARLEAAIDAARSADSDETRREAIGEVTDTLFGELLPENRAIMLAADMVPVIGNIRAGHSAIQSGGRAYDAISQGNYRDAFGHAVDTLLNIAGAAAGNAGLVKAAGKVAQTTDTGRMVAASIDLARAEKAGPQKGGSVGIERLLNPDTWASYAKSDAARKESAKKALMAENAKQANVKVEDVEDINVPKQQSHLEGVFSYVKGAVAEQHIRDRLADLGAPTIVREEVNQKAGTVFANLDDKWVRRVYDELVENGTVENIFGTFVKFRKADGKTTGIEVKAAGAQKSPQQKRVDEPSVEKTIKKDGKKKKSI